MSVRAASHRRGLPPMSAGVAVPRTSVPAARPSAGAAPPHHAAGGAHRWSPRSSSPPSRQRRCGWAGTVLDSSWLRVHHLVVTGTTRLSRGGVEGMLDGMRGQNILRVDFERFRRTILDSPWVADVTMWRRLPSTVEVRVRRARADGDRARWRSGYTSWTGGCDHRSRSVPPTPTSTCRSSTVSSITPPRPEAGRMPPACSWRRGSSRRWPLRPCSAIGCPTSTSPRRATSS